MICKCSCPKQWPHRQEEWCRDCLDEWLEWLDDQAELHRLEALADLDAAIRPATDTEWVRRLDEIAPRVEEWAL